MHLCLYGYNFPWTIQKEKTLQAHTLLTTRGGSIPPKVGLPREKEIIQWMEFRNSPFSLPIFSPNLVLKWKFKVWSKIFCSLSLKIVDLFVRKGGSFEPPEPPQRTGLLCISYNIKSFVNVPHTCWHRMLIRLCANKSKNVEPLPPILEHKIHPSPASVYTEEDW